MQQQQQQQQMAQNEALLKQRMAMDQARLERAKRTTVSEVIELD